jgi:hypothetical protein
LINPDKEGEGVPFTLKNCVPVEMLADYSSEHPEREISSQERQQIQQHLEGCRLCRETLKVIRKMGREIISGVWDNLPPLSPEDEKRMEKRISEMRLRLERLGYFSNRRP